MGMKQCRNLTDTVNMTILLVVRQYSIAL